jgi:phytoene synthase
MTDAALNRQVMAEGSASFRAATRLFDRALREDVWALYAWCRYCDDQIDGQALGHGFEALTPAVRAARLKQLREETAAALAGRKVASAPFQALQSVALRHRLSPAEPMTLLDGFAMDVEGRRFDTMDELLTYCWGVAGVVGVMMAQIMGARDPSALRRAQDLGLAFQLTNIVRDILEDARAGRAYLPGRRLASHGVGDSAEAILAGSRPAVHRTALELLDLAEAYYASSRAGLRALPLRAALATAAARGVYREIGRRIRREGPAALERRVVIPRRVKLWLAGRGALVALWSRIERFLPVPDRPNLWTHV